MAVEMTSNLELVQLRRDIIMWLKLEVRFIQPKTDLVGSDTDRLEIESLKYHFNLFGRMILLFCPFLGTSHLTVIETLLRTPFTVIMISTFLLIWLLRGRYLSFNSSNSLSAVTSVGSVPYFV